jgi:hypothetical protein
VGANGANAFCLTRAGYLDVEKDEEIRKLTGGAETNDGREHLMSSVNISSNSSKFWVLEVERNPT